MLFDNHLLSGGQTAVMGYFDFDQIERVAFALAGCPLRKHHPRMGFPILHSVLSKRLEARKILAIMDELDLVQAVVQMEECTRSTGVVQAVRNSQPREAALVERHKHSRQSYLSGSEQPDF